MHEPFKCTAPLYGLFSTNHQKTRMRRKSSDTSALSLLTSRKHSKLDEEEDGKSLAPDGAKFFKLRLPETDRDILVMGQPTMSQSKRLFSTVETLTSVSWEWEFPSGPPGRTTLEIHLEGGIKTVLINGSQVGVDWTDSPLGTVKNGTVIAPWFLPHRFEIIHNSDAKGVWSKWKLSIDGRPLRIQYREFDKEPSVIREENSPEYVDSQEKKE